MVVTAAPLTVMRSQKGRILNSDEALHDVNAIAGDRAEFNIPQPHKAPENMETVSRAAMLRSEPVRETYALNRSILISTGLG